MPPVEVVRALSLVEAYPLRRLVYEQLANITCGNGTMCGVRFCRAAVGQRYGKMVHGGGHGVGNIGVERYSITAAASRNGIVAANPGVSFALDGAEGGSAHQKKADTGCVFGKTKA